MRLVIETIPGCREKHGTDNDTVSLLSARGIWHLYIRHMGITRGGR